MNKTFEELKEGDKIYRIIVNNSAITPDSDNNTVTELVVEKIEKWCDYYTKRLHLSDKSHAEVNIHTTTCVIYKTPPESLEHPMAIFADIYATTEKLVLEKTFMELNEHSSKMREIRYEAEMLFKNSLESKNTIKSLQQNANREITEEEFAAMALS